YEKWLSELVEIVQPEILIFEAPIFTSKTAFDTARKLISMAGITEMVAKRKGIRDRNVFEGNNQTVKSHFAGTGRADKAAMVAACQQRGWDIEAGNHNEADALALFDYATACLVK
ncbi:MAG: hypothetical protein KAI73_08315, partial [Rhodospirillaceae bacterium]|nr:hypothetical protein [Rhodospirillaceae bacterium]